MNFHGTTFESRDHAESRYPTRSDEISQGSVPSSKKSKARKEECRPES